MTRNARFSRRRLGAIGLALGSSTLLPGAASPRGAAGPRGAGGSAEAGGTTKMRAEWIASVQNMDWPSRPGLSAADQRAEYERLLDTAVANQLNAVFVQVRPTATRSGRPRTSRGRTG